MFTQRISMDCTKEQYEKYLKDELLKMEYKVGDLSEWFEDNESITNYYADNGSIGNINVVSISNENRQYLGEFNAPLFLALAAMTDNPEGGYREYYVKDNEFYPMKESGFLGANGIFRKATVSEIMQKFGEPKKQDKCKIMLIEEKYSDLSEDTAQELLRLTNKLCKDVEDYHIKWLKERGYKILKPKTWEEV